MRIVGLDAGLLATGYGVVEARHNCFEALHWGVWRTNNIDGLDNKLKFFYQQLKGLLTLYSPNAIAFEGIFQFKNPRSAFMLAHVRGALIACAAEFELEVVEVSPNRAKRALTGYGRASKEQVAYAINVLTKISQPLPADASDAIGVAIAAALEIEAKKMVCTT